MTEHENPLPSSEEHHGPHAIIFDYLFERVPEFRELSRIRKQGWENPEGDRFFKNQRRRADNSDNDARTATYFFSLMQAIGRELHDATDAFRIISKGVPGGTRNPTILDLCMAPGGFLKTALDKNPKARALGCSLPESMGGHKVLLSNQAVEIQFLDITMLAADMGVGVNDIPASHPDRTQFSPPLFSSSGFSKKLFDLVICDGQVLRTHPRADYRETREACRLTVTQMALGLSHLHPGGTMVVLLHKFEALDTALLLFKFSKFSDVKVYKPKNAHAKRSSFYMVAKNVQSQGPEAIDAIQRWKDAWKAATFGSDEEHQKARHEGQVDVSKLLDQYGSELIRLGKQVWSVQAEALARAPFIKGTRTR